MKKKCPKNGSQEKDVRKRILKKQILKGCVPKGTMGIFIYVKRVFWRGRKVALADIFSPLRHPHLPFSIAPGVHSVMQAFADSSS